MPLHGKFITFEGIDGSGKTTQMRLLGDRLRGVGREVFETIEPGGTSIGRQIRRVLLDAANQELHPTTELLLYFASRAQNVDQCIRPALAAGKIVLCDRFTDSTLAYQGYARGLGPDTVVALDRITCRGLTPDLTLLIDVDIETSRARMRSRNTAATSMETRLDDESNAFHQKVRNAYLTIARENAGRVRVIDGRSTPEQIAEAVWEIVSGHV